MLKNLKKIVLEELDKTLEKQDAEETKQVEEQEEVKEQKNDDGSLEYDDGMAYELEGWIDNTRELYMHKRMAQKNLAAKKARGIYDPELAAKLMLYVVENAAKSYQKEMEPGQKWFQMFDKPTRQAVAKYLVDEFEIMFESGELDEFIPKKYQKKPEKTPKDAPSEKE